MNVIYSKRLRIIWSLKFNGVKFCIGQCFYPNQWALMSILIFLLMGLKLKVHRNLWRELKGQKPFLSFWLLYTSKKLYPVLNSKRFTILRFNSAWNPLLMLVPIKFLIYAFVRMTMVNIWEYLILKFGSIKVGSKVARNVFKFKFLNHVYTVVKRSFGSQFFRKIISLELTSRPTFSLNKLTVRQPVPMFAQYSIWI